MPVGKPTGKKGEAIKLNNICQVSHTCYATYITIIAHLKWKSSVCKKVFQKMSKNFTKQRLAPNATA